MANLTETSRWEAGIYQFETSDPVMGGPNGIDNRPTSELANRTLWLKNEIAKAVESIGSNKTAADSALATKAAAATQMIAGNGLTGGGTLADNRTLTLGTPSSITASSTNSVTTTSHTHAIDPASTSTAGIVQLSTATNSTATNMAATPSAVKAAYDLATTITRKTYSRSYTPVNTTTAVTISGDTAVHPDGRVVQRFVLSDIRLMDLDVESSPVGYGSGSRGRLLPLNLWTAMPNAVTDVRIQIQRAANNSRSQIYGAEACEWIAAWGQYLQATDKSKVSINLMRISGTADEYVDVFVIVEGY